MKQDIPQLPDAIFNASFIALILSIAAWALLEAWLLAMQAGLRAHGLATAAGLGLAFLSATGLKPGARGAPGQRRFGAAEAGVLLLLAALGGAAGFLVVSGLGLVLAVAAVCAGFLPWSRLAWCRHHPVAACAVTWAALAASLLAGRGALDIMFLPVASWILWVGVAIVLLARAARRRPGVLQAS